jgi:hypothetical protein
MSGNWSRYVYKGSGNCAMASFAVRMYVEQSHNKETANKSSENVGTRVTHQNYTHEEADTRINSEGHFLILNSETLPLCVLSKNVKSKTYYFICCFV